MNLESAGRLVLCLLLCLGVGILESIFIQPETLVWYAGLARPSWTPSPFVFRIAWSIVYVLMAVSLWRLWERATPSRARTFAILLFLIQLVLNAAWSPVFFGWQSILTALGVVVALLIAIAMVITLASRADKLAAWLLAPYQMWVAYATALNAALVAMN